MYQRHPVRIDKGRALSANNGPVSSSNQVAFHKIYRKRRCYSIVDKEQEGHSSSHWRSGAVNPQRENNTGLQSNHTAGPSSRMNTGLKSNHTAGPSSRMNAGLQSNYTSGPSSHKTSRRVEAKSSSRSAALSNIRSVKVNQQHVKRPNDRLAWNSPSGPEFDAPVVKKQKVANYDRLAWSSASGPDFDAPFSKKQVVESYKPSAPPNSVSPEARHAWNSPSGPEFDAPFGKKQKSESYKPSAHPNSVSPEASQGKQKMVLEDTKWMYKNQHAKMSGPYGVKQLMEGLHARFLQEDLPIYQVHEGKLCQPIELRHLVDDLQGCNVLMHSPGRRSFSGQRYSQGASKEMPSKFAKDADLPPGFGGRSVQLSEGPSCMYLPSATALAAGPQGPAGAFPFPVPDFLEADLPPGFEAAGATVSVTEPHITELSGSSRRLSTGAGVAVRSQGARGMHLSYEKLEPNLHERGHSSQHVSTPFSNVSSTMQGARILSDKSSWHTAWAYTPSNTRVLNSEAQTFSPPTVCIGLPVSQPAVQSWPVANNSLSAIFRAEPYSFHDARIQVNNGLVPKEDSEFSVRCGPDPLALIHLELLAAVKRTYAKSVLRAVIGEQLECWIDGGNIMGKSALVEKDSLSRETRCVEVGVMSMEANRLPVEAANRLPIEASTALANPHIGAAEISLEVKAAQCSDGSDFSALLGEYQCPSADASSMRNNGSAYTSNTVMAAQCSDDLGEYQCPSADASSMRDNGNAYTPNTVMDASLPSNTEENGLDTSRSFPSVRKAEEMLQCLEKAESCLSVDEAFKLSSKSSSLLGNDSKQVLSDLGEEIQHWSVDEILHDDASHDKLQSSGNSSDAVVVETERPFLTSGKKKGNVKSLKQLMLITSKLRSRHPKKSLLVNRKSKSSSRRGLKAEERRRRDGILIPRDNDGCARTSINGWLWHDGARQTHASESFQERDCSIGINGTEILRSIQSNAQTARTTRAQLRKFAADAKGFDICRLTQSKVRDKKLKFARSKIHNWGVFAVEPVEACDFVIEYIGELVRSRVSDIRERRYEKLGIGSTYLFRIDNETVVDATMRGGLARFINHSCDPNCFTKVITVEGSKKIFLYAKRHIEAGEELTYDYKLSREVQKVPCNCSSTRCRGSLG